MKRISFGLLVLLLPALLSAQGKAPAAGQKLVLEFADGPDLKVTLANKNVLLLGTGIQEGDDIPVGATIATGTSTTAELRLKPNGSIIKLAKSTSFTVAGLAGAPQEKNAFALLVGKMRAIAAKGAQYQISSKTAIAAVRGTDFAFAVQEGSQAVLMVAKGLVQFDKIDSTGAVLASIPVAAGEAADAFADTFAAFKYTPEQYASEYDDVQFQKLKESDVPDQAGQAETPPAPTPAVAATPPAPEQPAAAPETAPSPPAPESAFMKWLRDMLGFEIGSVTIDTATYSKAIIQPNLVLGKVKLGLYLPVIYSSNLFDPSDWYHPNGNDEWSFGLDYFNNKNYLGGAKDLAIDLALKIKYFEYGTQYEDPFYIKVGNLEDMTLGHGLIMRNYANDTDFPAIRRLGFDMGLDSGSGGFELVANDLTDPQIFGGRAFFRPVPNFKLAIGASAVVDWAPASLDPSLLPGSSSDALKLIGAGVDLDLPIIQGSVFGVRAFVDGAATIPYTTVDLPKAGGGTVAAGFQPQLIYDSTTNEIKNWGAAGGLIGNVLFLDWRLEYRYFTGYFRPSFFDGTYDRMRSQYAAKYLTYLTNPTTYADTPNVMGIYGEGGFKLINDKLTFGFGYFWPWSLDAGTDIQKQLVQSSDEFHARLEIKKGLIPIIDLAGAITYDKREIAKSIADGTFKFLDENTLFGGEIDIPVPKTPNLDLAVLFQTVPVRNSDGSIKYTDILNGIPEMAPSISIETRFHL